MISFREADILDRFETPEVHLTVNVTGSNILDVSMDSMFLHPEHMKDRLINLVEVSLMDAGFYEASDGTMSWAINGDSDYANTPSRQLETQFKDMTASFISHGFSIYDKQLVNPNSIITGELMRFILELK